MREMKDSGIEWIGQIPEEWDTVPFRAYVNERVERNKGNKTDELLALSFALGVTLYKDKVYNKDRVKDNFEDYKIVHKNDLVLSPNDIIKGSVFVSRYYGCISPMYYIFEPRHSDSHDLYYLSYLLRTKEAGLRFFYIARGLIGSILENGKYVTRRMTVSRQDLLTFKVLFPPHEEQVKIVNFLDVKCAEIDALSADIQSEIDTLEAYKRSVIMETVTKGLDKTVPMKDSGTQWLGYIPAHWDISRIGSVYVLRNTKVSDKDYEPLSVTMKGIVPQLDTAAKTNAHDDRKLVRKGDFVINSRSDRRGSCGISPLDGSVSLINTVLSPLDEMNPEYYDWLFHTTEFADEFYKWGHGIVDDLWTTGWQDMKKILIPYPSLHEQEKIAKYLNGKCSEIDAILYEKQEQLAILDDYKKSVIYEYVTGKKEVPVA